MIIIAKKSTYLLRAFEQQISSSRRTKSGSLKPTIVISEEHSGGLGDEIKGNDSAKEEADAWEIVQDNGAWHNTQVSPSLSEQLRQTTSGNAQTLKDSKSVLYSSSPLSPCFVSSLKFLYLYWACNGSLIWIWQELVRRSSTLELILEIQYTWIDPKPCCETFHDQFELVYPYTTDYLLLTFDTNCDNAVNQTNFSSSSPFVNWPSPNLNYPQVLEVSLCCNPDPTRHISSDFWSLYWISNVSSRSCLQYWSRFQKWGPGTTMSLTVLQCILPCQAEFWAVVGSDAILHMRSSSLSFSNGCRANCGYVWNRLAHIRFVPRRLPLWYPLSDQRGSRRDRGSHRAWYWSYISRASSIQFWARPTTTVPCVESLLLARYPGQSSLAWRNIFLYFCKRLLIACQIDVWLRLWFSLILLKILHLSA